MYELTEVQAIVQQLNIIDDTLFEKMAEDPEFCEEVISTILEQKVTVKKVTPQNSVKNLQGRSVVLDALCELENGEECNVEVQKANDDDHQKRVRYNTSCITANITEPGTKFKNVPDVIGIYISKFEFKQSKGGNEEMCDLVENYAKERAEEATAKEAADSARKLFENGVNYDIVRASITTISDEDLKAIYEQVTGNSN